MRKKSDIKGLKEEVKQIIDSSANELIELGRKIFNNPELKFEEFKAAKWLQKNLKTKSLR